MKTFGRILVILAMFLLVMGITYVVVKANSSSTTASAFETGTDERSLPEGVQAPLQNGERPDFDGDFERGGSWLVGTIKNISLIAIIVVIFALPKRFLRQKPVAVRAK